jgi:predicted nucleic acid-binding Zn ribbon protein
VTWHPSSADDAEQTRRLSEAIEHYLARGGHGEVSLLSRVVDVWSETVGALVAAHVQPTSIANRTLFVDVDQPAWSTEVAFMAGRILEGLQTRLGEPVAAFVKPRVRGGSG